VFADSCHLRGIHHEDQVRFRERCMRHSTRDVMLEGHAAAFGSRERAWRRLAAASGEAAGANGGVTQPTFQQRRRDGAATQVSGTNHEHNARAVKRTQLAARAPSPQRVQRAVPGEHQRFHHAVRN
jgi:hypothetical protein